MRNSSPCVIYLKSFIGCYNCKNRSVYCSLAAGIHGKGFENKPLAWWITLLHHICSVLELETADGPTSVLPNYADVDLSTSNMPDWASRAVGKIRTPMSKEGIAKRWTELQSTIMPSWTFYTMPHSLLASLGDARPIRPYWPRPGVSEVDVILRGTSILGRGRTGALPRVWATHAKIDGWAFSPREDAKEAKTKKETKPKKKEGRAASENSIVDTTVPSQTQKGKCRVVCCVRISLWKYTSPNRGLAINGTGAECANRCGCGLP